MRRVQILGGYPGFCGSNGYRFWSANIMAQRWPSQRVAIDEETFREQGRLAFPWWRVGAIVRDQRPPCLMRSARQFDAQHQAHVPDGQPHPSNRRTRVHAGSGGQLTENRRLDHKRPESKLKRAQKFGTFFQAPATTLPRGAARPLRAPPTHQAVNSARPRGKRHVSRRRRQPDAQHRAHKPDGTFPCEDSPHKRRTPGRSCPFLALRCGDAPSLSDPGRWSYDCARLAHGYGEANPRAQGADEA